MESCVINVYLMNPQLMIPRLKVNLGDKARLRQISLIKSGMMESYLIQPIMKAWLTRGLDLSNQVVKARKS